MKNVLILSYLHAANFGDRLGYHVLNSALPPHVDVTYGSLDPWNVREGKYDLLILGIGTSLLPIDVINPRLSALMDRIPSIGIFGTQYRELFSSGQAAAGLSALMAKLTTWWARYEEDLSLFGHLCRDPRHLGDWLITAFPMTHPTADRGITVPPEIDKQTVALDRFIQSVQAHRAVESFRLHPLLCALTSAEEVAYHEQRDVPGGMPSGKFGSMLLDIFGRTYPEGELFSVDRQAVVRYKAKVAQNIEALKVQLFEMLRN